MASSSRCGGRGVGSGRAYLREEKAAASHYVMIQKTIQIDEELLARAMALPEVSTEEEAVNKALKDMLRLAALKEAETVRGEVEWWPGYLEEHG